jgi:Fur family transcriptional regulator, stress-responsive regulator
VPVEQPGLEQPSLQQQSFEQQLRSSGLQVTAQRLAIMQAVADAPHATVEELSDRVRDRIGTVSRQAIYDGVSALADKGLIRRIQPIGSPARFESRVGDNHHHLVCRGCGLIFDIDCAVGSRPCLDAADDHGFDIDEAEVVFWGRCSDCRAAP